MEANVSKYTNAIGSGKQAITQRQKRKGGRGMREGWEYKKLGELVQVLNGYAFKSSLYENQGIRVLRITNVQKGNIVDDDPKYYPLSLTDEIRNYLLKESDLLMSLTGNVGRVGLLTKEMLPAALNQRVACLRILSNGLNLGFLFHYLNSDKFEQDAVLSAKGIAQKNMSTEWLKDYKLPLPPISVQQLIVSELDKINELIRLKKEQLKDYDNLAQSIFFEMFGDPVVNEKGWEVKKLGEVAMIKTGPFGSMLHKEDYITGGIPLINPMHIQNFKAVPDKDFSISKEKAAELCNYQLKINDVIFARRGDIGRCAVISDKEAGCLCGTGSLFVRFERKLSSIYTMYVVRTTSFIKELVSKAKGATMLNLNSSTMENLRFPIPPLPLQQLFAQRIELIEKQKAEIQSTIADLETLLASRMQYWFD